MTEPEQPARALVRRRGTTLLLAFTAALLLWNLPFGGFLLYPFKLFATWLHEMSHGLMMLVTGTGFDRLEIFKDTSGLAYPSTIAEPFASGVIASAGYLGTAIIGAALLVVGQTAHGARRILWGFAIAFALSMFWVGNPFGSAVAVGGLGICVIAARVLPDRPIVLFIDFIAAQACISAVLDIRVLFQKELVVDGVVVGASDAHTMAAVSFGDHRLWATVWLVMSFACFYAAVRVLMRREVVAAQARGRERAAS